MKIKINVIDDAKESSVQDEDYLEQAHTIGQPVHVGDVLLVKAKDKLFKCEVVRSDNRFSSNRRNQFDVRIYPLDEKDKHLFESATIQPSTSRKYLDGSLSFDVDLKTDENGDTYWEIDFTKGYMGYEVLREKNVSYSESLLKGEPFTVVKFLTKSVPSSVVQDNDLTEYKPSIKPLKEDYRNVFNPSQAIGEPVEDGDTFLIEAADKSFKCEIHETDDLFKNHQNLFTARIYPLDKDDVSIAYEDYFEVVLMFDQHVENHDHYVIDFTKGKISPVDYIPIIREDTPFTVTKFLAHSGKTSTVQDHNLDLTYISKDLNRFVADCLEFKELVEDYKKTIEECIEDDQRSVELDGYDGEDPVESPNKKYLEMITFCIDDVTYNIDELIDQIRKR